MLKKKFRRKKKPGPSLSPTAAPMNSFPSRSPSMDTRAQIAELEHVFRKFDANGDGKISSSELRSIMDSLGQKPSEEELQKIIEDIDCDGDGCIDLQEFLELNTDGVDSEEVLRSLREAFSVYDIDGNGLISAEELHKVMKRLNDECSLAECRKMISGVDRNGDGMISFDEFKDMMMNGSRQDLMDK